MIARANIRLLLLLGISSAVHAGALLVYGYPSNTESLTEDPGASSVVSITLRQQIERSLEPVSVIESAEPKPFVSAIDPRQVVTSVSAGAVHHITLAKEIKEVERYAVVPPQAAVKDRTIETQQLEVVADVTVEAQPPVAKADLVLIQGPAVEMEFAAEQLAWLAERNVAGVAEEHFNALRQQVGEQLLQSFDDYFRYPLKARRKGWQGDVLLAVELSKRGHIEHVRVLKSSGYRALDSAALKSMRQIESVTMLELPNRLSVQVPISYRLVN